MLPRAFVVGFVLFAAVLLVLLAGLLRDPKAVRRRVLSLFRHPERAPLPPGADHYYRRYWS